MKRAILFLALVCPLALTPAQTQYGRINTDRIANTQLITITGATPSVSQGNIFKTNNGSSTTITNFRGAITPQRITVICGDTNTTIQNGSNIVTASGSNITCVVNQVYEFEYDPVQAKWIQTGGSSTGSGAQTGVTNTFTAPENFDGDTRFKGLNPYVDISRFGGRAVSSLPSTTATCTAGSPTVTVGNSANFQVGDYASFYGCGATITTATPAAPTLVSGASQTITVPDAIISAVTGANTFQYLLVTRDAGSGLTLPGPAVTTNTGVTLGKHAINVTSASTTGNIMNIVLASNAPPNGTRISFRGSTNSNLSGYYQIASGGGTTTITIANMPFWSNLTGVTGGTIVFFNGNELTWTNQTGASDQIICGKRPGDVAFHVYGVSLVGGTSWVDWGSPITTAPTTPSYITDAVCVAGSALNDIQSGLQITKISGTTWTLSGNVTNNGSGQNVVLDDSVPLNKAYVAAHAVSGGGSFARVLLPCYAGKFWVFTSPVSIAGGFNPLELCGSAAVYETLSIDGVIQGQSNLSPLSSAASSAFVGSGALPILSGQLQLSNISFTCSGNQGQLVLLSGANENHWTDVHFNCAAGSEYSTLALYMPNGGNFPQFFDHFFWNFGPGDTPGFIDTDWCPMIYFPPGPGVGMIASHWNQIYGFGRGIGVMNNYGNITSFDMKGYYLQGPIQEMLSIHSYNGTHSVEVKGDNWVSDTGVLPMIGLFGSSLSTVKVDHFYGVPQLFTGVSPIRCYPMGALLYPNLTFPCAVLPDTTGFNNIGFFSPNVSDNFNRADGGVGANWLNQFNSMVVSGNQAVGGNAGAWNAAYYVGQPVPPGTGQYAAATLSTVGTDKIVLFLYMSGGRVAAQGSVAGYSCIESNTGVLSIQQALTGAVYNTVAITPALGDQVYFTVVPTAAGNVLTCTSTSLIGVVTTASATDGAFVYQSGYPGMGTNGASSLLDNFQGGALNTLQNTENYWPKPQHVQSITVGPSSLPGATTPTPGSITAVVLDQPGANKYAGTCVFAASTTCSVTYAIAYNSTPVVMLTPVNPGSTTFTLTASSNTGFTITASGSNSLTVNWAAIGNPN